MRGRPLGGRPPKSLRRRVQATDCAEALSQISIGYALCTGGDLTAAESHFLRVVETWPELPMGHNNLGWLCETRKDFEAALQSYRRALELDPSFALARRNSAALLFDLGRFTESRPHWDMLISRFPYDTQVVGRAIDLPCGPLSSSWPRNTPRGIGA